MYLCPELAGFSWRGIRNDTTQEKRDKPAAAGDRQKEEWKQRSCCHALHKTQRTKPEFTNGGSDVSGRGLTHRTMASPHFFWGLERRRAVWEEGLVPTAHMQTQITHFGFKSLCKSCSFSASLLLVDLFFVSHTNFSLKISIKSNLLCFPSDVTH